MKYSFNRRTFCGMPVGLLYVLALWDFHSVTGENLLFVLIFTDQEHILYVLNWTFFRTVLLDNKDKKRASIPKTQVSRKVVSSGVVNNVPSSSRPTSSSPGQSYSGPGRGSLQGGLQGSLPSSRPGSPMSRPTTAHSPVFSQNVSSHPPQPAQPRNSYQQTHKPAPSRPSVNTEIMKRPLR